MSGRIQQQYEKKLLNFLNRNPDQIFKARFLSREFAVPNRDYRAFREFLKRMAEADKITRHKGNRYGRYVKPDMLIGSMQVKAQGYGFLIREDGGEDVFISQKNMGSALHRDRVKVELWARSPGRLPEGKVREVLERGRDRLVGVYIESNTYHYVVPDDFKVTRDIYVAQANRGKASTGQKVVVEIFDWGEAARMPEGRVVEVLGYPDDPGVDVLSVAHGFDLPIHFSPAAEEESKAISDTLPEDEIRQRQDFREMFIITIDPEDARDFDDAISLEVLSHGNLQLGVHIADVSAYVPIGSSIDREALSRGTSVYLVDRVIPMLPERLSNQLCSLKPDTDRLAYSVMMELTREGELVDYQIRPSVIRSRFRLSYKQAQQIIKMDRLESGFQEQVPGLRCDEDALTAIRTTLIRMQELSQKLRAAWRSAGSIDFDAPEPMVRLDDQGKPVGLGVRPRYDSHRLIEAFMLMANRTVAEHIHRLRLTTGMKLPFIYRTHQKPTRDKLDKFVEFVRAFGYVFDPGKQLTPKKFQHFLNSITDPRHKTIIDEVAVRTMMKAVYTTANQGHFGLATKDYTHFTSPIRRYPDLMVHRLLKAYQPPAPKKFVVKPTLAQIAAQCTEREIVAQEAERESVRAKQVDFMAEHIGMEFNGIVSGVTSFGLYVELPDFLVEGLVAVRDLQDDYYLYDEKKWQLKGEMTGKVYQLGDPVEVQVARVHREMRKLDFILAGNDVRRPAVRHKRRMKRKRR